MGKYRYLLAGRSNRRHHKLGNPGQVFSSAVIELVNSGVDLVKVGPMYPAGTYGRSRRRAIGSAGVCETDLEPEEVLEIFNQIHRKFGQRLGGMRWFNRVIEPYIILWSGGSYVSKDLVIPHPRFREWSFVLYPATKAGPRWRDPVTGLTIRQLNARLTGIRPLPRGSRVLRTRWMGP